VQNVHLKPTLRRKRKALSGLDGLLEVTAVCYRYRKISSYAFRKPCNGKFLRRKGSVFFTKSRMVRWWCVMSLRPRACRLLYRSVCYLRMMLTIHSYLPGCRTSTILWPVPHCTCWQEWQRHMTLNDLCQVVTTDSLVTVTLWLHVHCPTMLCGSKK